MTCEKIQVYVGTYKKYNESSLFGKWMELDSYSDKEDFLEACRELHKDEVDAELMFQDHEGIPEGMINESWVSEDVWTWLEMDEHERNAIQAYKDDIDQSADNQYILDRLITTAESFKDYADELADELLSVAPKFLKDYFDYESFARDLEHDYSIAHDNDGTCYILCN